MSKQMHSRYLTSAQDELRFQRYLAVGLGLFFCISIIVPFIHLPEKSREALEALPPQLTAFVLQEQIKRPKPQVEKAQPESKVPEKPKPVDKKPITPQAVAQKPPIKKAPEPPKKKQPPPEQAPEDIAKKTKRVIKASQAERQVARAEASQAGVFAMKQGLSELANREVKTNKAKVLARIGDSGTPQMGTAMAAVSQGASGGKASKEVKNAAVVSQGVDHSTGVIARADVGAVLADGSGSKLSGPAQSAASQGKSPGVRDESDIRKIFEKNKAAIYSIYARAQRKNEDLAGKLVLEIKISPSGRVEAIHLIDSELADEKLVGKIITRVKMFSFGEQNVALLTMRYTFDFVAS